MNNLLKSSLNNGAQISLSDAELQAENQRLSRVKWACRRGMLELDLLLSRFVEKGYVHLSREGQDIFFKLLSEEDTVLYAWLMRQADVPSKYAAIIGLIKSE